MLIESNATNTLGAIKELVIDDFASYDINKLTPSEQNMYNSITQQ